METTAALLSAPRPCADVIKVNTPSSPTRQWEQVANLGRLTFCQSCITNRWRENTGSLKEAKK